MKSPKELITELNTLDEHPRLEAKACRDGSVGDSFYETVCAFSNEPDLGGGSIVLGVSRSEEDLFNGYDVHGVTDPDKVQQDISTGCATRFDQAIRPEVVVELHGEMPVMVVHVRELPPEQKPLRFANRALPEGAWRRIGSTDQRCTEEDLVVFFGNRDRDSFDQTLFPHCSLEDLDADVIEQYRTLRRKANAGAEELNWSDLDLLQSLRAIRKDGDAWRPTLTGLLLFGSRMVLRRELPMVRVDYIRVAGNEWVSNPDQRFEKTVDMRGPLLQMVDRVLAAVMDDLPKGFELRDGDVQAETPTLPTRVLREAIVNALMHRSYRVHQPTQVIRYRNRVEIKNAGFSLKNEDSLGETGSQLRNPSIAAIFHETNTAETKGSGIRTMRRLMKAHGFSPPTFESSRADNFFISRLLLHHFLSETDLVWLKQVESALSDPQRIALIFLREQGAIDNQTLRQLTDCDVLTASSELRKLRDWELVDQKGRGSATYYVPGPGFPLSKPTEESEESDAMVTNLSQHVTLEPEHVTLEPEHVTLEPEHVTLAERIPEELKKRIENLGVRPGKRIRPVILELCNIRSFTVNELSGALGNRNPRSLKEDHLSPLIQSGHLKYTYPDMVKHPDQAYITSQTPKDLGE